MQDGKGGETAATGSTGATGATGATGPTGQGKESSRLEDLANKAGTTAQDGAMKFRDLAAKYVPPSISVIVILVVSLFLGAWVRRHVRAGLERAKFDPTLGKFFANMLRWLVLIIGILFCLNVWDISTTTFAAVLGAAGLAIGLALQGSLGNLAAGIMLLIFRPFKVGDTITVIGQTGVVHEIDLFTTAIDTADGRRVILPNGQIFGSTIENATFHPTRRADVRVSVAASSDVDHVRALLEHAALGVEGKLDIPGPTVTLVAIGATLDWDVSVWARTPDLGMVRQALIRNVRDALAVAGFEMPNPITAPILRPTKA
jgi:small conductance mechanosensitive channel